MKRLFLSACPFVMAILLFVTLGFVFFPQAKATGVAIDEDVEDGVADGWMVQVSDRSII